MHVAIFPALVLFAAPAAGQAETEWFPLERPVLSQVRSQPNIDALRPDGQHIYLEPQEPYERGSSRPLVPSEVVTQLLESRARESGQELTLLPGGPPLLASGSQAALDAARSTLSQLNAVGTDLEFQVRFWVFEPTDMKESDLLDHDGKSLEFHTGTFQPGERIEFGEQRVQPFLANYDVDVANDSGVASPVIGEIVTGRRISLRVHRVADGSKFFVHGVLDLAELGSMENFETDALDLGLLQQPTVASLQLAFSALTTSAQLVRINVSGAPLSIPDFGVLLKVENLATSREKSDSSVGLIDLSFLGESSPYLPAFQLGSDRYFRGSDTDSVFPSIPARALTSLMSDRRGPAGLYASNRTILVDNNHPENARKLKSLIASYESGRLSEGQIKLQFGNLRIEMPSTSFAPTRVSAGIERAALKGYNVEIAPEIWMPAPEVERSFDGLVVDATQTADELRCSAISTHSSNPQVVSRMDANLGQVQLRPRGQKEASRTVNEGPAPSVIWLESDHHPELSANFIQPAN